VIAQHALEEAMAHLGAALIQTIESDDQIIMNHVRAAHTILQVVTRAQRAMQRTPQVSEGQS
jgi:hypothetical protein